MKQLTGVGAARLRAWEQRYEFPRPSRLPGGHRRYTEADAEAIKRVLAERASGLALPAALARAREAQREEPAGSMFAVLRQRHPALAPVRLSKRTLVALSHAIEDEAAARAERGLLVGCFQRRRFYQESKRRWRDLASGARLALAFADFGRVRRPAGAPSEVPLRPTDPVMREWVLAYLSARFSACLVARELPGQEPGADLERQFETIWSPDPNVVRQVLGLAVASARAAAPKLAGEWEHELTTLPPALTVAPESLLALTNRVIAYLNHT